jgi:tetratricopeptide (TPR) repeat protein
LDILLREGDDDPLTTAGLWMMLGGQSRELGEYDRAELEANTALTIARDGLGPRHPFVARVYGALADTARARGDSAAARGFVDAGLAIERGHGDSRGLTLPSLLYQRGLSEQEVGEHARAIETLEEAVALYREVGSEDRTSAPLTVMASSQLELGLLDAAHGNLSRALELEYRRGQRARTAEAQVLHNLGEVEAAMGRVDDARRRYATAIELMESALGPEAALLSLPLTGLGELELAAGNPALARALLERALPLCSPLVAERDELAETSFALARALWADPGATAEDRRRAIEHARAAADAFAEAGAHEARRRDEAVRWVEDHQAQVEADVVVIEPTD